ncbi:XRE family transcriptional regulator [Streptomyces millisiae]|uniref:XRE family transcriptional regulator n=1 Tax=Streptomyces millisiae TaxID=3075542 RepID=A0ABU2LK06_9ACTN|nr:XRE family transcriptional regulator [Streptomyces sp. DSM 44918]MDT0317919.1 XRE family transcriptional regulator [Streptomyces sp. DSM 44918]
MNYVLREALTRARLTVVDVAADLGVDPKTVERWIAGRMPHPRSRGRLSALLNVPEAELWPDTTIPGKRPECIGQAVTTTYPHRWCVPPDVWREFFASAERSIDLLVYSGLFLIEDTAILRILKAKASSGVEVRLLLGDPSSEHVAIQGAEEGIGDAMSARIRNAFVLLCPLVSVPGIEIRSHNTTLYNSIFRADDGLLINMHLHGQPAAHSPVVRLYSLGAAELIRTYMDSFEQVWAKAGPQQQVR